MVAGCRGDWAGLTVCLIGLWACGRGIWEQLLQGIDRLLDKVGTRISKKTKMIRWLKSQKVSYFSPLKRY